MKQPMRGVSFVVVAVLYLALPQAIWAQWVLNGTNPTTATPIAIVAGSAPGTPVPPFTMLRVQGWGGSNHDLSVSGRIIIGDASEVGGFRIGVLENHNFVFSESDSSTCNSTPAPCAGRGFGAWSAFASTQGWSPWVMWIKESTASFGIGTASPQAKLHVVPNPGDTLAARLEGDVQVTGNFSAAGNIAAKYQDLAEWVPSSSDLDAGTVVVLDERATNTVRASTKPYDTAVAGVISAQPGIALGEAGSGKELVATTGRVKVRVDATNRPIKIGDLLVSGDRVGFAMRSDPIDIGGATIHRPGTVLGKALEPLKSGEGEILVLLTLQ
ncbi:MAG: hypothetical protein ACXW29_05820 [Thermoanaerobaculia bacterium]